MKVVLAFLLLFSAAVIAFEFYVAGWAVSPRLWARLLIVYNTGFYSVVFFWALKHLLAD